MKVLFEEAAYVEDARPGPESGSRHDDSIDSGCADESQLRDRTPSYRIQLVIYRQADDIWAALKEYCCATGRVSPYEVAAQFYPMLSGTDVKERHTAVAQDHSSL